MQRSKYRRNRRSKRMKKSMMKGGMKGGMCPPCLMAGGVASGKLMLGAAAGITGISSVAVLKSKKKNSFKRGGSKIKKRKGKKKKTMGGYRRNKTKRKNSRRNNRKTFGGAPGDNRVKSNELNPDLVAGLKKASILKAAQTASPSIEKSSEPRSNIDMPSYWYNRISQLDGSDESDESEELYNPDEKKAAIIELYNKYCKNRGIHILTEEEIETLKKSDVEPLKKQISISLARKIKPI